jgi:hypothetical protein
MATFHTHRARTFKETYAARRPSLCSYPIQPYRGLIAQTLSTPDTRRSYQTC